MSIKNEIEKFVVKGFKKTNKELITDGIHSFVLKNPENNFITPPRKNFKYHRWAGSLKSSQAFAYNIFSGMTNKTLQFEFPMKVFTSDAEIDVMIEDKKSTTIELFEVKAFEISKNSKITFNKTYFYKNKYKNSNIAEQFINFLNIVIKKFENQKLYGEGIKQLCSHLLGIINIMDEPNYINKKFKLYSFCFDNPFSEKFEEKVKNYKDTLTQFKKIVDKFLKDIKVNNRINYCGCLSSDEYIRKHKNELKENYDYVMNRYFFKT